MSTSIVWFRRDLRLADNPALRAVAEGSTELVCLYVHAPEEEVPWAAGAASRWWLHHSLRALERELERLGSRLLVRRGPASSALSEVITATSATRVTWNRLYEPAVIARDRGVKEALRQLGCEAKSFPGSLLHEPWGVLREGGEPYRVFTPYWKACLKAGIDAPTLPAPRSLPPAPPGLPSVPLPELGLLPSIPWDEGLGASWSPGEEGARTRLRAFVEEGLLAYAEARDRPDLEGSSRLSPHLHFGEISARQVARAAREASEGNTTPGALGAAEGYLRQIGWREFAHHLLYHFPHTPERPLDLRFERFPWALDRTEVLEAWQHGHTGYPLVDAGMRELWASGWMHNRVRMVVASFLTKNLRIPWQEGARWFWDTLVDANLANNTLGWQWTAGCGADAAPYFRVFNPMLQGQRHDPAGAYIRRWVPELARLSDRHLYQPGSSPADALAQAGVRLGEDYPEPIVDFAHSRRVALEGFERIRNR